MDHKILKIRNVKKAVIASSLSFADIQGTQTLDIGFNNLRANEVESIVGAQIVKSGIRVLLINDNKIGDGGVAILAEMLKTNTSLQHLDLSNTGLTDVGVASLAEALKMNNTLGTLILRTNTITDIGVRNLTDALAVNTMLHTIDLSWCQIGEIGAVVLAQFLKNNNTLVKLSVNTNNIGTAGAIALMDMLGSNTALHTLELWSNNIKGGEAFVDGLRYNSTLQHLKIMDNPIGDITAQLLIEILQENYTLLSVGVDWHDVSEKLVTEIFSLTRRNKDMRRVRLM